MDFLALVIRNGAYLIARVRFYDAFDVIWSRVDAEWSLRSIFMWILWFFVYHKTTVNIFNYHAFAIKTRPALHFHTPLSSRTIIMIILMWFHPWETQNTHFGRFYVDFMNFKSSVLTAIQQIEVKCRFLASAIENGNYLTIQVHFDGNFDVIWSRVGLKHALWSVFMWIMRISGWPF